MQRIHVYPFKRISLIFTVAMICLVTTLTAISWSTHFHTALAANSGPALTIDASAGRHIISRDIYGMASPDSTLQQQIKLPEQRWGGDAATNYNWLQDSTNAGSDWYYVGGTGTSPTPTAGGQVDSIISAQQNVGGDSLVTVPIIGYVDNSASWNCSYPSSLYPTQQSYDPYIKLADGDQCGNGKDTSGNQLTDNNISLDYNQVDPSWMQAWIQHIVQTHGNSAASNVVYQLDNEPENWNIVHNDVHPNPVGYDELVNDSINYAKMIKATDSTAQIMGPSNGYSYAYVHLKDDPGDDMASHNGEAWIPYYLQQMSNYQKANGTRLLDYLDVHYYGDVSSDVDDTSTDAARLDSTRALWDPTYSGSNSVGQYLSPPQQIGQIPALQNWVQQYYPGTKTSISEYYFGDAKNLNGALTEADVLGIFGSQGLDSANMWYSPAATDPAAYAFRMYLNYDGNGSKFGDTSVQASSADQGQLSIYAAQRSSDNALTLMMINKTGNDLTSNVALNNFSAGANAQVYTYSGANLSSIVQQPDVSVSSGSFTNTFPANSITLVVIPPSGSTGITPTPTTPTPTPVVTPTSTPTGGPTTLNPTDDRDNWPTASGTASTINISQWQTGYFKFDLSSLGSSISSAHFKLYRPDLTQGDLTLTAYQVSSNSWSEGSNDLPPVGSAITTASSSAVGYVDFDLTSYIQAALAGGSGQVTIAIGGSSGGWQDFYSKDNGSNEPELIVQ